MDKRWMYEARHTTLYTDGVARFIQFAFTHSARGNTILCPCRNCYNSSWLEADVVREHLVCDGFVNGYTRWEFHGEANLPPNVDHTDVGEEEEEEDGGEEGEDDFEEYDEMAGMIRDMRHAGGDFSDRSDDDEGPSDKNDEIEALKLLAEYNSEELYPGCTGFSKLRFMVRLLHTKSIGGWSDKSFDMLLELLREAFPKGSKLPKNFHEAKKMKSVKKKPDGRHEHKVPRKVLRYFPITKRLQRLFISPKSATDCRWHVEGRTRDGLLRHPADSPALNLPPWLCMKQPNFMLSLLFPGPKSPGADMDVFLEPLIDDLELLFEEGVRTYDASKKDFFYLCAAVHSTITDLPGMATAAGCATSGEYGCPKCHSLTCSLRLNKGNKTCYMDHRRFLDENHPFRTTQKDFFDGKVESRTAPVALTGAEVDALTQNMKTVFGKHPSKQPTTKKRKRGDPPIIHKRRSIWFRLRYWKDLLQPHNLDAMHIEKNVCDNIVYTLLGIDKKTKDNYNTRRDLVELGLRGALHPVPIDEDLFDLPSAPYTLSPELKRLFCLILKGIRFPAGYASDIRKNVLVKEKKIVGLKSHENHILLQYLLSLAVRKTLPEGVSAAIIRVSTFFRKIYSPVIRISDMEELEKEIAETLSILETIFLPSFFDMMVHLMVHLPLQVRLGGPVKFSNMYAPERYNCKLKGYVRTRSHPEGSIAEGYLFDECLTFCSRYLEGCDTRFSRTAIPDVDGAQSNSMPFFNNHGRCLAGKLTVTLDHKTLLQAHRYVLFNYDDIDPYLSEHAEYLSSAGHSRQHIEKNQHANFHEWFRLHVAQLVESDEEVNEEISTLAARPSLVARSYGSYTINGYNFHTKSYDEGRPTQSSGVALVSKLSSSSTGNKIYYGVIKEIIELDYNHKGNIVLFKCEWFDNRVQDKWVKVDNLGITYVKLKHVIHTGDKLSDEPFILASQATQEYYVEDPLDLNWCAVNHPPRPRDFYDLFEVGNENSDQAEASIMPNLHAIQTPKVDLRDIPKTRADIDGVLVSVPKDKPKKKNGKRRRM